MQKVEGSSPFIRFAERCRARERAHYVVPAASSQPDQLDEDYPDGWEISELVVTARFSWAPEPVRPWMRGRVARIQAGT